MPKPTAQACHALTTYYIGRYEDVNGIKPNVNRNKAKFTFEALLYDYSKEEVHELLDYFIRHYDKDLEWFNYNYEKVVTAKVEHERNKALVALRRKATAERLEQWKKRKEEWAK